MQFFSTENPKCRLLPSRIARDPSANCTRTLAQSWSDWVMGRVFRHQYVRTRGAGPPLPHGLYNRSGPKRLLTQGYSHVVCFGSPVFRFRSSHFAPSSSTRMSGARACDRLHNTLRHCAPHSTYSTGSLVYPIVDRKPLSSVFRNCCACSNCFTLLSHKTVLYHLVMAVT